MKVRDAMHEGVFCVDADASVREIARNMKQQDIGAVPVRSAGGLVGMVTDRDIACRGLGDGADIDHLKARDVMTKGAICCLANDDLDDAVAVMEGQKIRRLPVMDHEQLVGMLSLGDVSRAASRKLSGEVLKSVSGHHR